MLFIYEENCKTCNEQGFLCNEWVKPKIYLMLGSSNSLKVAFEDVGNTHELNRIIYPEVYKASRCTYPSPWSGKTTSLTFRYPSNSTTSG
jgi:hypothetical protein